MQMDERKYLILQAIIDDYISTALPVGSRTISRKSGVGFSPATIRNEMSDLEELGYLDQPHTSAGRVPSNKAYRLYVDQLMKVPRLSGDEREWMQEHLAVRTRQVESLIRSAATVLSDATQYTSVILAPRLNTLYIRHIQLVPVSERMALMVIVTNAGIVKDAMVRTPEGFSADDLYAVSRSLTEHLANRPIEDVRVVCETLIGLTPSDPERRLVTDVLQGIENKLENDDSTEVFVGGSTKLLDYPEYSDVTKARSFLSVLESKDTLRRLIKRDGNLEITIRIGPENGVPELEDCSTVSASYRVGSRSTGTLGIIGPTRMNYNRVISVLDFMGRALSDILTEYR